ncbi:MAG: hypothetical protein DRN15_04020 [Thermoprotei archaeon]|mgnify:CR=1 FL=1|nr:MAG: hypothetical protein DRN15_04020 [Thermoprotei archaeon]RLF25928.1 MAG: hypothetical protein DRM97_00020 [Thermoprotei archaeon]
MSLDDRKSRNLKSSRERPLVVLKLGGSLITDKSKPMVMRRDVVRRLCKEISRAINEVRLILVHGAGSFGHPQAKMYRLDEGFKEPHQLEGVTVTKIAVETLTIELLKELKSSGTKAIPLHPMSFALASSEGLPVPLDLVVKALDLGLVPLLHGDVVLDSDRGFRIVSGDYIATELAIKLKAKRLIFAMEVDGIFTSDPLLDPEARLLSVVKPHDLRRIKLRCQYPDVTKGILGKAMEAFRAVEKGIEVLFINGLREDYVYRALIGETPEICTRLSLDE